jgi:hypothetical protein
MSIRPRLVLLTVRPLARTMPWGVLLAGCVGSVGAVLILGLTSSPLEADQVRLVLLPIVAALCFVPHVYFRPVIQTVPVPSGLAAAGHTLLAAPLLAATCAVDLYVVAARSGGHAPAPALYPLVAQFTGWAAVAVLTATWCDRTRFASLNGALAAPVTIALITLAWTEPHLRRVLITPGAQPHAATAAWYAVAPVALVGAWAAGRDPWHRYTRVLSHFTPWP